MKKRLCIIFLLCFAVAAFGQTTEKREVSGFIGIDASTSFNIQVAKGSPESLTITADEELMPYIRSEVKNGILKLYIKTDNNKYKNIKSPTVKITMKDLTFVDLSGACTLESDDTFEPENFFCDISGATNLKLMLKTGTLKVDASGASKLNLEATAKKTTFDISGASKAQIKIQTPYTFFDISGASNVTVDGSANEAMFDVSGASKISAFNLTLQKALIDLSGTCKLEVNASESLSIDLSGMSTVYYKGSPTFKSIETSGMSKIKHAN